MAKTEKELQELKEKFEELNKEFKELSDEEIEQVSGGVFQADNLIWIKENKKGWF